MATESADAPSPASTAPAAWRCWLALLRRHFTPGALPRGGLRRALQRQPDPCALAAGDGLADPALRAALQGLDWDQADRDLEALLAAGATLVPHDSPDYPPQLAQAPAAPLALFVRGDLDALHLPQIALVGSRKATAGGLRNARDFARFFAAHGLTVTSGLALGIDAAGHEGALAGGGKTVAVMGTGVNRLYPARHAALAEQILAQGALVSEYLPGTPPLGRNFPQRNRIISGLSLGVLVVEAARSSGSLLTARGALEQGREVFAIPGSIHSPVARGCHALIREGAKLVEEAQDVVDELGALLAELADQQPTEGARAGMTHATTAPRQAAARQDAGQGAEQDPEYTALLGAMGHDPVSADELIARTGLAAQTVSSMLLLLELEGHVSSVAGGLFIRNGSFPA